MAYVPPSDWELRDFIRDHAEAVYCSCAFLSLGRLDAEEMTREIILKVLNQGMEFKSEQDARAWMILTAYQMSRWIPKDAQVQEQCKELQKLRRKDLLVALLYYCEGFRKKEIADYLGCTEAAVRRRLARVKRKLAVEEAEEPAEQEPAEDLFTVEEAPTEAAPEQTVPAEEAAPEQSAPAEEAAPEQSAPAEEAAPEEPPTESMPEAPAEEQPPEEGEPEKGGDAEC